MNPRRSRLVVLIWIAFESHTSRTDWSSAINIYAFCCRRFSYPYKLLASAWKWQRFLFLAKVLRQWSVLLLCINIRIHSAPYFTYDRINERVMNVICIHLFEPESNGWAKEKKKKKKKVINEIAALFVRGNHIGIAIVASPSWYVNTEFRINFLGAYCFSLARRIASHAHSVCRHSNIPASCIHTQFTSLSELTFFPHEVKTPRHLTPLNFSMVVETTIETSRRKWKKKITQSCHTY